VVVNLQNLVTNRPAFYFYTFIQTNAMRKQFSLALLLLTISFISLIAQQKQQYLIKAGKLFDSETAQFKTGMIILVSGNIIDTVKAEKELTANDKKNYTLIDLSKFTVLPGLIDCHTHLLCKEILYPNNSVTGLDMNRSLVFDGDAYRALYGAARAKAYLEAGITAVQDLGNSGLFADVALNRAITEGLLPGPRMRCSGPGLSTYGGQIPGTIFKHQDIVKDEYRIIKNPLDAADAVRENVTQGATVIKIFANNTPNRTMLTIDEIKAIVDEAHRYDIRVTAHATSNKSAYNAIMGGVDGIEHGYELHDSTLELMAKKGVILVPTDGDSLSLVQYFKQSGTGEVSPQMLSNYLRGAKDRMQRAYKKGVIIAAGSDDYIDFKMPFAEPSKRTLIGYYESGIPIPAVLQFATFNAAKQLRWTRRIGTIKKGFYADIIAVDNKIETDISAILDVRFVMKDGKVVTNKLTL